MKKGDSLTRGVLLGHFIPPQGTASVIASQALGCAAITLLLTDLVQWPLSVLFWHARVTSCVPVCTLSVMDHSSLAQCWVTARMWLRGIRLSDLFHTSYQSLLWSNWCSIWIQVFERNIQWYKKLRAVFRRPGSLQLATAACNLTKQQLKRVVSNLKKSSQAAHSWYETKTHSQGSAPAPAISGAWLSCADLVQNISCLSAEAHWGKKCTNFLS